MIQFACPKCGKHYKVGDALAGKRAKCKGCGDVLAVPAVDGPMPDEVAESRSMTESVAASSRPANQAVAIPQQKPAPPMPDFPKLTPDPTRRHPTCPGCGASMGNGTVFCIACGFDVRTGKRIAGVE